MVQKKLKDGSVVEAYPLTQAQRFMYFVFNTYGKNPAILNIGTGCYWKGEFDRDVLLESLKEAIERCDTMRLRFSPDQQFGLVQYMADSAEIEIEEVDHTGLSEEESFNIIKEWTKTGVDMIEKPLNTVKIMHLPDGSNGFYTKFHHLAFDGYSSRMFLSDTMAIYVSKRTGKPYPKPMKSYIDAMKKELEYLDSEQRKIDRGYFMNLFSTSPEPVFNDYLVENRVKKQREENNDNRRYLLLFESEHPESRTLTYNATAEDTNKVMAYCKENGLSVPCVLMLALRTALSAFNERQNDVSFKYMINRRATLLEKKSGGNRWHLYAIRTIIDENLTFEEALAKVEEAQDEVFHHASFDPLEMYHIKHMAMKLESLSQTYDSMSFSYHAPQVIEFETEENKRTAQGIWYNSDYSCQNLYYTIKHRLSDGGFEFIFEYRINEEPQEDLALLFDKFFKALMMGVENPKITIKEILDKIEL